MAEKKAFHIDEELKHLEEINQKLARTETTLEEALELYKEGTVLAAECKKHLEGVEKELEIINKE